MDGEGITITKYIGKDHIVIIPEYIKGIPVNRIGGGAFDKTNIRALYIPDSVEHIEKGGGVGYEP